MKLYSLRASDPGGILVILARIRAKNGGTKMNGMKKGALSVLLAITLLLPGIWAGGWVVGEQGSSPVSMTAGNDIPTTIDHIYFGVDKISTSPVMDGIIDTDEYGEPIAVVNYGDIGVYWNGYDLGDETMKEIMPKDMTIYAVYDDTYLYVGVTLYDENHWTPGEGLDVWDGDYIEVDISTNVYGSFDDMRDRSRFAIGMSNAGNVCIYSAMKQSNVNASYSSDPYRLDTNAHILDSSYGNVTRDEDTNITTYELRLPWKDISHSGKPVSEAFFMVQAGVGHEDFVDESEYVSYLGTLRWAAYVPEELQGTIGGACIYHVADFMGVGRTKNDRTDAGITSAAPNFSYGANGQDYISGQEYFYLRNDLMWVNFFNGEAANNAPGTFSKGAPSDFVALSSGRENVDWGQYRMKTAMDAAWDDKNSNLDLLLSVNKDNNTIVAEGFAKNVPGMDAKVTYSMVDNLLPAMMFEVVLTNNGTNDYTGFFEYLFDPDESSGQVSYVPGVGYSTSDGRYIASGWTDNYLFNGPNAGVAVDYTAHTVVWPDDQQPSGLVNEGYISGVWFDVDIPVGESVTLIFYHVVTSPANAAAPYAEAAIIASILSKDKNSRAQAGISDVAPPFTYGSYGQDYIAGEEYYYLKNDLIWVNFFNGEAGNNSPGTFSKGAPADFVAMSSGRENVDWGQFRMKTAMDAAWNDKPSNLDMLLRVGDDDRSIIAEGFAKNVPGMDAKVTYSLVSNTLPAMMFEVVLTNNGTNDYTGFFEYLFDPDESGEQVSYVPGVGYTTQKSTYITSGWTENFLFNGPNQGRASNYTSHTIVWPDERQPSGLVNEGYISGIWFDVDIPVGESVTLVFYHVVTVPTDVNAPWAEAAFYADILSYGKDYSGFELLTGRITDSVTKTGVPHTSVTAKYAIGPRQGEAAATVMTDANGNYAMLVEKDVYTLTATALTYKQESASIDMTVVSPELSFEMQPLVGTRALKGVPLTSIGGGGVEATPGDFVVENDLIVLSVVDTGDDPQVPRPFTKGRILDMSTLEASYDGMDWIYTSWLTNSPVTGEQWNRYTTRFDTIEVTQNTSDLVVITATGVYAENIRNDPNALTCEVVQVITIRPGDYFITVDTTIVNVSGGTYSLYAGDILDYDFGGAQISYAPGIGEITADAFRSGVLTEPWIAQYGGGAAASKQTYGIIYDDFRGDSITGFGPNRWMGAYHQVTLENEESYTYSRRIAVVPNADFENPWDAMANLYYGMDISIDVSIDFNDVLYEVGNYVTAKVTVRNTGESDLENVAVRVSAPYQLAIADDEIIIPSLAVGETAEVELTFRAIEGGRGKIYYSISAETLSKRYSSWISVSGPGWYGGDNHSHTTYSDGSGSIKDNTDAAYAQGLSWLYSTDHNSIRQFVDTQKVTDASRGDFFSIAGNEITSSIGHALGYSIPYADSSVYNVSLNRMPSTARTWQTVIDEVTADGGYFYVAHPNYPGLEFWDVYNIRNLAGLEVWNGFYHPIDPDRNVSVQAFIFWDTMNSRGESKYFGIANSDGHNPGKQADPYSIGYMDVLSIENIDDTLKNGRFFGTNGPQLRFDIDGVSYGETLYINGNSRTASMTITAFDDLYPLTTVTLYKLRVTGNQENTREVAMTWDLNGQGLNFWSVTLDITVSDKDFYRVEIASSSGTTGNGGAGIGSGTGFAFSNPIWVETTSSEGNAVKITDVTLNNPDASIVQNRSGAYYIVVDKANTLAADQLNVGVSAGAVVTKTYDASGKVFNVTVTSPDGTNVKKMNIYVVDGEVSGPVPDVFTVTFKDWNGTVLKTENVEYGNAATAPSVPNREGYTFAGWDKGFSNVTADLIVTARYTADSGGVVIKTPVAAVHKVTNDNSFPIGPVTVSLEGYDAAFMDLSVTSITSMGAGESIYVIVVLNEGLPAGDYFATVVLSDPAGVIARYDVKLTVDPVYGIEMDKEGTQTFPGIIEGSENPEPITVTVKNIGNVPTRPLTVTLSGKDADAFVLSSSEIGSIEMNCTDTFTVVPKADLAPGTYTATVTVNGINGMCASFDVSFTVDAKVYEIGVGGQYSVTIDVFNAGNMPTGTLTVTLSGSNASDMIVSATELESINVGGKTTMVVMLDPSVAPGTYKAILSINGENGIFANYFVSFVVEVPGSP